jgi:cytochrome c peroxidase
MNKFFWFFILLFVTGLIACSKEEMIMPFRAFEKPATFPEPSYRMSSNPITKDGFELGRKLFYERMLSSNNTISCGSCHIPTAAFTHHGHSVSHGINDLLGTRNSPPIMNLAWSTSFMWDGGIGDLDLQALAPITSHVEMDETVENVIQKLRNSSVYPALFQKAYGSSEISTTRFLKSISQFMLMCVSSNSRYDSVQRNPNSIFLNESEERGYTIFKAKCNSCHTEPLFTDQSFRNNGLNPSVRNDKGRYLVTLNPTDEYRFKVPSLRNLKYTAPYMHDGRFFTLDAVLSHYTSEVSQTPNLDPLLQSGTVLGIPLNNNEKADLLDFLETLNDRSFVTDSRFFEQ